MVESAWLHKVPVFSRAQRLSRIHIPLVLQNGRRFSSKNFTIVSSQIVKGYTVIIPKKYIRLSVTRHLLKRRIYGVLANFENLPSSFIVLVRAPIARLSYHALAEELHTLLSKI